MIRQRFSPFAAAMVGMAAGLGAVTAGAMAAELPMRWTTGAAVWSTPQQAIDTFLRTGAITDRGLDGGLNQAAWSPEEIRAAMNKLYSVNLAGVARFLRSPAGEAMLQSETRTYYPYWSQGRTGLQALRAAILTDAGDGRISSASILASLPTNMRVTPGCQAASGDCPPLFTWWVFLPARIQAGAHAAAIGGPAAAGAPAAAATAAPAAR